MAKSQITMDELLESQDLQNISEGDLVTGQVLSVRKHELLVDLGAQGVGIVPRREIGFNRNLKAGDEITVSVVDSELETGYSLLSLRKAAKDHGWEEIVAKAEAGETLEVTPYDANRGGLLVEYEGVRGFLPVSQLSSEHYPRVGGSDKDEILTRLNKIVSKTLHVRVLDHDRKLNKLIFSEKEAVRDILKKKFEKIKVGDVVKGRVTGLVDFGAFVNVDGIEGLVHISEISWVRVTDPGTVLKVGDEIDTKVLSIDKDRLSLSIRQLTEDPWLGEVSDLEVGSAVDGTVTRITPFGAFVQISPAVEALVHISELKGSDSSDPEKVFTLNEKKQFFVYEIDRDTRKISLSLTNKKKPSGSK